MAAISNDGQSILGRMGPGVYTTTQHAYMLLHNPWAAHQPVEYAYRLSSILWDDFDVVEFARIRESLKNKSGPIPMPKSRCWDRRQAFQITSMSRSMPRFHRQ